MKILLIEDDQAHCVKYKECTDYLPYTAELSIANGCVQGLEITKRILPDIILLDLELHRADGDGILFLVELKKLGIKAVPYIIVITVNSSRRSHRMARQCGADYIFTKTKPDYSPRLVLDFAYNYFSYQDDAPSNSGGITLEEEIAVEIEMVGITNGMAGRNYIIEAVLIILNLYSNNLKSGDIGLNIHVYPVIARKYRKSDKSVEQGIRNAIKKAWLITEMEALAEHYTAKISYKTGFPENRNFLFYYADKFKQGKAGHM